MCYGCWEEEGSPAIVNDKTKAAAKLVEELYEYHCSGGYLHIVTDDYNLKQHNIDWCATNRAEETMERPMDDVERRCYQALVVMTDEERGSAIAIYEGWVK